MALSKGHFFKHLAKRNPLWAKRNSNSQVTQPQCCRLPNKTISMTSDGKMLFLLNIKVRLQINKVRKDSVI